MGVCLASEGALQPFSLGEQTDKQIVAVRQALELQVQE